MISSSERALIDERVDELIPDHASQSQGNEVQLLIQGKQFFAALLEEIEHAQHEVRIETYIFAHDAMGQQFCDALCRAAERGVKVRIVLDGFGGVEGVDNWVPILRKAAVRVRVFRPEGFAFKPNPRRLRRMHRKIAVVDARVAFVGGINLIDDFNLVDEQAKAQAMQTPRRVHRVEEDKRASLSNLAQGHLGARYDFAVRVEGPAVHDIWNASEWLWWQIGPRGEVTDSLTSHWWKKRALRFRKVLAAIAKVHPPPETGHSKVQLVLRDNFRFRRSIEKTYLRAIAQANDSVILANAYFLPGRRFLRALKKAADRGVKVQLLLQGRVEHFMQHYATQGLYDQLLRHGVEIYEYAPSFLHAKVAVVDSAWATVGSSNIDPFSLLFAREANLVVFDKVFTSKLRQELTRAITDDAKQVRLKAHTHRALSKRLLSWACYLLMRLAVNVGAMSNRP